jgi:two-component system response regulator YesN
MYNLVIVDDEKIIREGLVKTIDWQAYDCKVTGVFENGLTALENVKKIKPDIVLTDIKMPGLNGIQLLKSIKEWCPEIKVIMLSGHDDFEFAREAMLLGAEGYIQKIKVKQETSEVFKKTVKKLQIESKQKDLVNNISQEKEFFEIDYYVRKLCFGEGLTDEQTKKMFSLLRLKNEQNIFCLVNIFIDCSKEAKNEKAVDTKSVLNEKIKILNEQNTVISSSNLISIYDDWSTVLIVSDKLRDTKRFVSIIEALFRTISREIKNIMELHNVKLIIGIGSPVNCTGDLQYSFLSARRAGVCVNPHEIISITTWSEELFKEKQTILEKGKKEEFINSIVDGETDDVKDILSDVKNYLQKPGLKTLNINVIKVLFTELYVLAVEKIEKKHGRIPESVSMSSNFIELLSSRKTTNNLITKMEEVFTKLAHFGLEERKKPIEKRMDIVCEYMEDNYFRKLSIEELAEYVYMSPNYFSSMFKRIVGKSYSRYITEIRMMHAKDLLEKKKQVHETAYKVGYNDVSHFSKIFKKYFGINPSEVSWKL